jgi:hypothetical protein
VFSNTIVGYSIHERMKSSLARSAMRNAIALRTRGAVAARCLVGGRRAVLKAASHMAQQLEVSFDPCGDEWQSL